MPALTAPPRVSVPASDWTRELAERVTVPVIELFPERFSIAPLPVEAPLVERAKLLPRVEPPWTSKLPELDTLTVAVPVAFESAAMMTPLLRLTAPVKPELAPVRMSSPVFVLASVPEPVIDPPKVEVPVPTTVSVPVPRASVPPGMPLRFQTDSVWAPRLKLPPLTARVLVVAIWFEALSLTAPPAIVRFPSTAVVLRLSVPELTVVVPV